MKTTIALWLLLAGLTAEAQTNLVPSMQSSGTYYGNGSGLTNLSLALVSTNVLAKAAAATLLSLAVPAGVTNSYTFKGYLNVTAVSVDVIQMQVGFTDEQGNVRTVALDGNITSTGFNPVSSQDIRVKGGTTITISAVLTTGTGSITYDAGASLALSQ